MTASPKPDKPVAAPEPEGLAARRAALTILALVRDGATLEEALERARDFAALEGADRAFARALATAVLRRRGTLDFAIEKFLQRPFGKRGAGVTDILRLGAAQLLLLETPAHAAVATSVALADARQETAGYKGVVNAILRRISEKGGALIADLPARIDTPGWMWRAWERAYGPQVARRIAAAHQDEPALDLTVKDPGAAAAWAERLGGETTPTGSVRLRKAGAASALDGFDEGAWWVQDMAAALPARLLGDVAGLRVADLCAAPGGKTLQLAAAGASVTAIDRSAERLERLSQNLERTGLAAEIVVGDALEHRPAAPYDAVLLDAPCSATGTIRRHPDALWSKAEVDVETLSNLQTRLLDAAADMLKPGGRLVFCVCSLQREEGEAQAAAALQRRADLERLPIAPEEVGALPVLTPVGDLRTLPFHGAGMDGFFAARFVKRA
ncbi:MAG: transcription antitermination factor NusB [Pseudomonadota bacterium]